MKKFEGRAALVANAASPVGRAIVKRLAADGALVMAADADAAAVAKLAGGTVKTCVLSVTALADWDRALAATVDAFKRLDILVTIATAKYAKPKPIAETSLEEFRAVNAQNLEGAFLGVKSGIMKMRALGNGGAVVNVASVFATRGLAGQAAYAASSNGVRMMTRAAALSCADAKDRIRVNAVQVGLIEGAPEAEIVPAIPASLPLAMRGSTEDVAAAVAFLASDQASYITGYVLPVDGGLMAA